MDLIVGWRSFLKSCKGYSWLVLPRKIRTMSSMNLFQKGIDKGFMDGFFMSTHEKVGIWWGSFGSHGCVNQFKEMLILEGKFFIFENGFK